jgi:hypothetical protein
VPLPITVIIGMEFQVTKAAGSNLRWTFFNNNKGGYDVAGRGLQRCHEESRCSVGSVMPSRMVTTGYQSLVALQLLTDREGFKAAMLERLESADYESGRVQPLEDAMRAFAANGDIHYIPQLLRAAGEVDLKAQTGRYGLFNPSSPIATSSNILDCRDRRLATGRLRMRSG